MPPVSCLPCQPSPPRLSALGRQGVQPIGQRRKGGDCLLSLRLLGSQGGGLLGFARREVGRLPFGSRLGGGKRLISLCSLGFYLRPLGGQACGICGIIRDQIVPQLADLRFSGGKLRF
jgi:hypothetical protein